MSATCYHCQSSKDLLKVKAGFWLCDKCSNKEEFVIPLDLSSNITTAEFVVDMIIADLKDNPSLRDSWEDMDELGQVFTRVHWINLIKPFL